MVFILQKTLLFAIPLLIVALAGMFSERSGVINLSLDGGMIFGAFIGVIFSRILCQKGAFASDSQLLFFLSMIVSSIAGGLFSLLLSFSAINMKANQTISGTALNLLAPAIVCTFGLLFFNQERIDSYTNFVITKQNYSPGFQKVFDSPVGSVFEVLFDKTYISTYIVIILFIVLSIWLYKSKTGTHLRACGEHPQAADSVGINVYKMRYIGTTISGALAGLGGYIYAATCSAGGTSNTVSGLGFLALAIMIFGNWNPGFIAIGSVLFGFLKCLGVLSTELVFLKNLGLPFYFYNLLPYLLVLIVLIVTRNKNGCPKSEGIPYDKGQR